MHKHKYFKRESGTPVKKLISLSVKCFKKDSGDILINNPQGLEL